MPRRSNQKNKKSTVSVHRAPSMQGMQQVGTWDLVEVVPILLQEQGASSTPTDPYVL
jgi:hypothetical protein